MIIIYPYRINYANIVTSTLLFIIPNMRYSRSNCTIKFYVLTVTATVTSFRRLYTANFMAKIEPAGLERTRAPFKAQRKRERRHSHIIPGQNLTSRLACEM